MVLFSRDAGLDLPLSHLSALDYIPGYEVPEARDYINSRLTIWKLSFYAQKFYYLSSHERKSLNIFVPQFSIPINGLTSTLPIYIAKL